MTTNMPRRGATIVEFVVACGLLGALMLFTSYLATFFECLRDADSGRILVAGGLLSFLILVSVFLAKPLEPLRLVALSFAPNFRCCS